MRRFARSALQKKWDLFWKYKTTVSLPKSGYNYTFVVKARFVHSIADGTYKMLNAHRIYLSAPRRTPKCTCTSVVAWQKILHTVAATLWFFYLQLYKSSQLSTLVLSSNAWKAWKMKPKSRFFYKGMCITFTLRIAATVVYYVPRDNL